MRITRSLWRRISDEVFKQHQVYDLRISPKSWEAVINLTGQSVYVKGEGNRRERGPNAKEKKHWERVKKVGCITKNLECEGRITKHHTGTGAGGRKNHMKVLPLCWEHHLGDDGINSLSGKISRREWEQKHGTEQFLLRKLERILHAKC